MSSMLGGLFGTVGEWLLTEPGLLVLVLGAVLPIAWEVWRAAQARGKRRKTLFYNVLLNSKLSLDPPDIGDIVRLYDRDGNEIPDPSLAVIRISNEGQDNIDATDYQFPVTLRFPANMKIRTVEVTDVHPSPFEKALVPAPGATVAEDQRIVIRETEVVLPRVNMNSGTRYKVMVVGSSGGGTVDDVKVDGIIVGGHVVNARQQQQRSRRNKRLATAVVASLSVGALVVAGLINYTGLRPAPTGTLRCVGGDLLVGGSSAFATAAARIAGSYESYCPTTSVQVVTTNSRQGLEQLRDSMGGADKAHRVALSDGKADESLVREAAAKPVAIVPYTIVLNRAVYPTATGQVDLTLDQVRKVFDGRQKTWREIDDRFADIEIRIVARGQSGSRITFERYVLGDGVQARPQGPPTSSNCSTKDYTSPNTFLCEESTTSLALGEVARLDGAVGYADTPDAARSAGVILASIDGRDSGLQNIMAGYPFWTVEYAYHDGRESTERSVAAAFVEYLTSASQAESIATAGYPPCGTNTALCERR